MILFIQTYIRGNHYAKSTLSAIQSNIKVALEKINNTDRLFLKKLSAQALDSALLGKNCLWAKVSVTDETKEITINALLPLKEQGFKIGFVDYSIGSPKEQDFIYVLIAWGKGKGFY